MTVTGRGSNEYVHSFVSTAVFRLGEEKHELVFPARMLAATAARHIGTANVDNLEYLFGCSLDEAIKKVSQTHELLCLVATGDAATGNISMIHQFLSYAICEGKRHGLVVTGVFTMCLLHQMARLLTIFLSHQALTASLYSISKLTQHAASRDATKEAMKLLLQQRFRYHKGLPTNSSSCRSGLFFLLTNSHDEDDGQQGVSHRTQAIKDLMDFFNGNLLDQQEWTHFCDGCHASRSEALQHATRSDVFHNFYRSRPSTAG